VKSKKGFSLIEVLISIVIIAILGSIIGPKILGKPDEAKALKARSDIASISSALMEYNQNEGNYPTTAEGLPALVNKLPTAKNFKKYGYLYKETIIDPWGKPYLYNIPGENWYFTVWTLGKDGKEGGEGVNATIKSRQ